MAYADFVTAMMAFFLVMWICGQDQKIKRAVSYYFTDPFGASNFGTSKKPYRSGAMSENMSTGALPNSENVSLGRGRNPYSDKVEFGPSTKIIGDWLHSKPEVIKHWQKQADHQRELAKQASPSREGAEKLAVRELSKQLKEEVTRDIPQIQTVYKDLLLEIISDVNWNELAEDLLEH